jgi:Uri superfamily endonuclease
VTQRDGGAYCLLVRLDREADAAIGRLGRFRLPAGHYVYCGSALRGLAARTARHMRRHKTLRWHIDYLLALPQACLLACLAYPSDRREECQLNQAVQRQRGASVPVRGFGSSDCCRGCPAHLTHFAREPRLPKTGFTAEHAENAENAAGQKHIMMESTSNPRSHAPKGF